MTDIAARDHVHAARVLRRHLATYEENRDLVLMGAYRAGADPAIDAAIACHPAVIEYIRQDSDEVVPLDASVRSEEHTSELQSLMRISYAVFCLKQKKQQNRNK